MEGEKEEKGGRRKKEGKERRGGTSDFGPISHCAMLMRTSARREKGNRASRYGGGCSYASLRTGLPASLPQTIVLV